MKTYIVKGYAFVPVEISITVQAGNSRQAVTIAKRTFKADKTAHIVGNSEDYTAAFGWEPTAEEAPAPQPEPETEELRALCEPHAELVTEYLRTNGRVKPTEDWRAMAPDFRARVLRNPAGFLKMALARKEIIL
jgi:hypothetical protein